MEVPVHVEPPRIIRIDHAAGAALISVGVIRPRFTKTTRFCSEKSLGIHIRRPASNTETVSYLPRTLSCVLHLLPLLFSLREGLDSTLL